MTELEQKVLEAIESRGLSPRPYAYFLAKRSVLWGLAALSVMLGGIAVAVLLFAVPDYFGNDGRGFDEMPLDDLMGSLPVVWLLALAVLMLSAWASFRQTPRGYRHTTGRILAGVLALSSALGVVLHVAEAGRRTHEFLATYSASYAEFTRPRSADGYPDPDKGGLAGTVKGYDGKAILLVVDFSGQTWTVDVSGSTVLLDEPLGSPEDVEMTGTRTGANTFQATSIKDWD
jgi:hypothetical protein